MSDIASRLEQIDKMNLSALARATAAEEDEDVIVPPAGSAGAQFLLAGRRAFIAWVREADRWPVIGEDALDAGTDWHLTVTASLAARAYVDLGLFFSAHARSVLDASAGSLRQVLDQAASALAVTLSCHVAQQR